MHTPATIASPAVPRQPVPADGRGAIVFDHVSSSIARASRSSTTSVSRSSPARMFAIVGRPAPANPPSSSSSTASTTSPTAAFWSMASMCATGTSRAAPYYRPVQQDVFLFAGDVLDNVRLSRTELGEREIRDALARAQALTFVERLPGGLHEDIHERGANLSPASASCSPSPARSPTILACW